MVVTSVKAQTWIPTFVVMTILLLGISPEYALTPNDPFLSQQWYLGSINAFPAWDTTVSNNDVVVAGIDAGFAVDHTDLKENIGTNAREVPGNGLDDDLNGYTDDTHGWNFVNENTDLAPYIDRSFGDYKQVVNHGSLIAGIIGAMGNNNEGIAGLTWHVRLMLLRVLDERGGSDSGRVARAIQYAVRNGAQVINLSFVGNNSDPRLQDALNEAAVRNVLVVAAAGNEKN